MARLPDVDVTPPSERGPGRLMIDRWDFELEFELELLPLERLSRGRRPPRRAREALEGGPRARLEAPVGSSFEARARPLGREDVRRAALTGS